MGFKFVKREPIDCDRISEKRLERFKRDVSASRGMLMRAIVMVLKRMKKGCLHVSFQEHETNEKGIILSLRSNYLV